MSCFSVHNCSVEIMSQFPSWSICANVSRFSCSRNGKIQCNGEIRTAAERDLILVDLLLWQSNLEAHTSHHHLPLLVLQKNCSIR